MIAWLMVGILSSSITTFSITDIALDNYDSCRSGAVYGSWLETDVPGQYHCDVENIDKFCWKVTKTRCYEIDEARAVEIATSLQEKDGFEVKLSKAYNGGTFTCRLDPENVEYSPCKKQDNSEAYLGELI